MVASLARLEGRCRALVCSKQVVGRQCMSGWPSVYRDTKFGAKILFVLLDHERKLQPVAECLVHRAAYDACAVLHHECNLRASGKCLLQHRLMNTHA